MDIFLDQANTSVAIIGLIAHTPPTELNISLIVSDDANFDYMEDLCFVSDITLRDTTIFPQSDFQQIAQISSNSAVIETTQQGDSQAAVVPALELTCPLTEPPSMNENMVFDRQALQDAQQSDVEIISELAMPQSEAVDYGWFKIFSDLYSIFSKANALLKKYDPLPNFPLPVVAAQKGMRAPSFQAPPMRAASTARAATNSGSFSSQARPANDNFARSSNIPTNARIPANDNIPRANINQIPSSPRINQASYTGGSSPARNTYYPSGAPSYQAYNPHQPPKPNDATLFAPTASPSLKRHDYFSKLHSSEPSHSPLLKSHTSPLSSLNSHDSLGRSSGPSHSSNLNRASSFREGPGFVFNSFDLPKGPEVVFHNVRMPISRDFVPDKLVKITNEDSLIENPSDYEETRRKLYLRKAVFQQECALRLSELHRQARDINLPVDRDLLWLRYPC